MLRLTRLFSALVVAAIATTAKAEAADPKLRLCTARKDGIYYFVGERIATEAAVNGVDVQVVETAGSLFNMAGMQARLCDAAIAQADAVLHFNRLDRGGGIALAEPVPLHREFVHLVCRHTAGLSTAMDLATRGKAARVLIGEPGSGSTVTWTVLSSLEAPYGAITVKPLGRSLAVATLAEGQADCLLYVAGIGSSYMMQVDGATVDLRLIDVDSEAVFDADVQGVAVYTRDEIPAGSYARLQPDETPTRTISMQALLITSANWVDRHPQAYAALRAAAEQVRAEILDAPEGAPTTGDDSPGGR